MPQLGGYPGRCPSVTTISESSIVSSQPETERYYPLGASGGIVGTVIEPNAVAAPALPTGNERLTVQSGMAAIARRMQQPDSGLEVRDRVWLKIPIPKAVLGSEVVDWLYKHVEGFADRQEAKKMATQMLRAGFLKHTVDKTSFSGNCYYIFGDEASISSGLADVTIGDKTTTTTTSGGSGNGIGSAPWASLPTQTTTANQWEGQQWINHPAPSIYNPSAPPPSQNYGAFGGLAGLGGPEQQSVVSSGSAHSGNGKLRLAGSGSGSESDVGPSPMLGRPQPPIPRPVGAPGSIVSTEGGFVSRRPLPAALQGGPQAYQAHC